MIMENPPSNDITIIGAGALGSNLASALHQYSYPIVGIFNRSIGKAKQLAVQIKTERFGIFPNSEKDLGQIVFLCVPDDELKKLSHRLVEEYDDLKGRYFVHCSGACPASEIGELKTKNALIASFHPIQTFIKGLYYKTFEGVPVSLQGDASVLEALKIIASNLKAEPFVVTEDDKHLLHIAAVFACNYMVTMAKASQNILNLASDPIEINLGKLMPLMVTTLENIKKAGPDKALSGPLKRGDLETIKRHLSALEGQSELKILYKEIGSYTIKNMVEMTQTNRVEYVEILKLLAKTDNE